MPESPYDPSPGGRPRGHSPERRDSLGSLLDFTLSFDMTFPSAPYGLGSKSMQSDFQFDFGRGQAVTSVPYRDVWRIAKGSHL